MFTKYQAEYLAFNTDYRARQIRGQWFVWCDESDHYVEFDQKAIDEASKAEAGDDDNTGIGNCECCRERLPLRRSALGAWECKECTTQTGVA